MKYATITIHHAFNHATIDKRLFGSFIEHMGSVIYSGIYEPDHPSADSSGFRTDVLRYVDALKLGVIRYPGGNFTSAYRWEDTIGPKEERPTKLELAWQGIETNQFGLNEFFTWLQKLDAEPIITINLGTRGIDAARNIVEYCNFESGTYWSDLRIQHGYKQPHNVKMWCLGNELDGSWQIGSKSAYEYGRLANEASKVMKLVDPSIETLLVGSSTPRLDSYPAWDAEVLLQAYDQVDYLTMHNYINREEDNTLNNLKKRKPDDIQTYLSRSLRFDQQLDEIIATCDYVKAIKRSKKTMYLAFDEWNVHKYPVKEHKQWQTNSPIDWAYFNLADTLLFASMGLSILRHADRVKIGCQSLLVNTIPLILTEENGDAWVNPTYYVMKDLSTLAKGKVLQSQIESPSYSTNDYEHVSLLDCVIVDNNESNELVLFAVNRDSEPMQISLQQTGYDLYFEKQARHTIITSTNLDDINSKEAKNTIIPTNHEITNETIIIPAYSWNTIVIPYNH